MEAAEPVEAHCLCRLSHKSVLIMHTSRNCCCASCQTRAANFFLSSSDWNMVYIACTVTTTGVNLSDATARQVTRGFSYQKNNSCVECSRTFQVASVINMQPAASWVQIHASPAFILAVELLRRLPNKCTNFT